jgi:hypothetical protein
MDKTLPGHVLGTAPYMPPEQASGGMDLVEQRSDAYGLGAVLYEILTDRPPFTGSDSYEVLCKVRTEAPQRPRQLCHEVSPALEAVCLRALAKKPADRYAGATELAEEVKRFLADQPVDAWPEPWSTRARRWLGRHRSLVTASAAVCLVAIVILALSAVLLNWERDLTAAAHREAVANFEEAKRQAAIAEANAAQARTQQERAELSLARIRAAVESHYINQLADDFQEWQSKQEQDREFNGLITTAATRFAEWVSMTRLR